MKNLTPTSICGFAPARLSVVIFPLNCVIIFRSFHAVTLRSGTSYEYHHDTLILWIAVLLFCRHWTDVAACRINESCCDTDLFVDALIHQPARVFLASEGSKRQSIQHLGLQMALNALESSFRITRWPSSSSVPSECRLANNTLFARVDGSAPSHLLPSMTCSSSYTVAQLHYHVVNVRCGGFE